MKLILKLITVGASTGVSIPKDVLEKLGIKKGERVKITIEKVDEKK
jgi:antitoxin component of MazEF toxin-antitoxin module